MCGKQVTELGPSCFAFGVLKRRKACQSTSYKVGPCFTRAPSPEGGPAATGLAAYGALLVAPQRAEAATQRAPPGCPPPCASPSFRPLPHADVAPTGKALCQLNELPPPLGRKRPARGVGGAVGFVQLANELRKAGGPTFCWYIGGGAVGIGLAHRGCLFRPMSTTLGGLSRLSLQTAKAGEFKYLDFFRDHWKENQKKIMKQKKLLQYRLKFLRLT